MGAQAWVALVGAGLAAIAALVTWQQKNRADRRSEWWRRITWAFERTFSKDDIQAELGWTMLDTLLRSTLVTKDDSEIVRVTAAIVELSASHVALGDGRATGDDDRAADPGSSDDDA